MSQNPKRVLVINDEVALLEQFKKWVEFYGYEAETTITGESGICKLKNAFFDLVFLDFHLKKERDGEKTAFNFIPQIREISKTLPIIVTSASHFNLDPAELGVDQIEYLTSDFWKKIAQLIKNASPL